MSRLRCSCSFEVEGGDGFVLAQFTEHCKNLHPPAPVVTVARDMLTNRVIQELSAPGSPLRSRLVAAHADLSAAGFDDAAIAARLESGESVD